MIERGAGPAVLVMAVTCLSTGASAEGTPQRVAVEDGYLGGAAGADLYYRVLGGGPDTVLVVHGGPGAGMGTILPHVRPLAERRTLILYDQRGGGRSELPSDTTLLEAEYFVEDLEAVRRHFGLERMSLVAHSFGAVLVARYAQRYPERLRRIVFLGATGPERARAGEAARATYGSADTATVQRLMSVMRELLSGEAEDPVSACREYERLLGELNPRPADEITWEGTTCEAPPDAVEYYYRYTAQLTPKSFGDWDFTTGLEDLEAPLLVVHGARDTVGLPLQRAWVAAVPSARLFSVPDAGKGAIADRPELVIGAIETFLAGRWPEGTVNRRATGKRGTQMMDPTGQDYGRPNPNAPDELSQFAFLIGSWRCESGVKGPGGEWETYPATWVARYILDGYVIADEFRQMDVDEKLMQLGRNYRSYDARKGAWVMKWLDALTSTWLDLGPEELGGVRVTESTISWRHRVPEHLVGDPFPANALFRNSFNDISEDHFVWRAEISTDGGATWEEVQVIEADRVDR